jgi:hypothetical protein
MLPRRLLQVAVTLATLVGPLAAVAHAELSGTVTTAPYGGAAPTMGLPLLAVLAVMLVGIGCYVLRRTRGSVAAKVGFVAALTAVAGIAYANGVITIEGAACGTKTVHQFIPDGPHPLTNNCSNAIQIISVTVNCEDPPGPNLCAAGKILTQGRSCFLPACLG